MRPLVLSFVALFVLLIACGDSTQGGSCDTNGATDECTSGLVCGHHDKSNALTCLKRCDVNGDCLASAEICTPIKGNIKGCVSEQL